MAEFTAKTWRYSQCVNGHLHLLVILRCAAHGTDTAFAETMGAIAQLASSDDIEDTKAKSRRLELGGQRQGPAGADVLRPAASLPVKALAQCS